MSEKINIDLTNVSEACGKETTYYGGVVVINNVDVMVDGCTDRTDNPNDVVWRYLSDNFPFLHDADNAEEDFVFENGKQYNCIIVNNRIHIEVINEITEISIELSGKISKERLNKLISIIDAQLIDGENTDDCKFEAWCENYMIYVNDEVW